MVDIQSFSKLVFRNLADLTNMSISLACPSFLSFPIFAIPVIGIKIAPPTRIISTQLAIRLPFPFAGFRTKMVLTPIIKRALPMKDFTTILTDKVKLWFITRSIYPTSINRLPLVSARIGTIKMLAALNLRSLAIKLFTTDFTDTFHIRSIA